MKTLHHHQDVPKRVYIVIC